MSLIIDLLLWAIVIALGLMLAVRSHSAFSDSLRFAARDFLALLPRIAIGLIGSGFIAEMLPQHLIPSWFGTGTGPWGLIIASVAGALTPGGPVVGFAIAAAALKGGAGAPQVIAYTIAWALFALPRVLILRDSLDAAARRVAACRGVAAAAVPRRMGGDAGGEAVVFYFSWSRG